MSAGILLPPREIVLPDLRPMLSVVGRALGFMGGVARTYATWNSSDFDSSFTLSGGNLTTSTNTSAARMGRSTIGKSSGKWYWEFTAGTVPLEIGIANSTASLTNHLGGDANGWGYYSSNGNIWNSSASAFGASFTNGDVIGFALDMDAGTLVIYKNNASQGTAASGLSGTIYAAIGQQTDGNSKGGTVNFGASAFSYTPPGGFNSGLYA